MFNKLSFSVARSIWIAASLLVVFSPGVLAQIDPCGVSEARQGTKPNIILILTDDQDLELKSLDFMPNVKALLADQGATFTHFFVPLSLCCPSRTGILRGQYPHNHMIWTNLPPDGGFQKAYADNLEHSTLATALQEVGYKTFLFGKYLNGYPATASQTYIPPGWHGWNSPVGGDPYGEYNYQMNADGTVVSYGNQPSDYLTDVMSATAVDFIRRTAQQATPQPFFMHLTTFAPHVPSTPAPRHEHLFPHAQAPRTPSFNESDVSDKPAYVQSLPLLTDTDIQSIDEQYRLRLRSLQAVDDMVGALVNELQADGMLADTYIFFTSDNGYHMGQHRFLAGKYTPYETDIRVPLIVRGPGVPAAIQVDPFAGNVDLAPTIAELAGATLAEPPDGRSLVPLLRGQNPPAWRQAFLIEQIPGAVSPQSPVLQDRQSEPPDPADLAMIPDYPGHDGYRASTYKYVEYNTGEKELYILAPDPDEMENQASAASQNFLKAASTYLATLKSCKASGCLSAEEVPPPSPVTADFTYAPAQPTDATPVTFTGKGDGVPPYTFTWDLGGQSAQGQTVTRTFPLGTYSISLTVVDGSGASDTETRSITVGRSVVIASVRAVTPPLRLAVSGTGFQSGCRVAIGGSPVSNTQFKGGSKVMAQDSGLKTMVPKGVPVQITVTNLDGTASASFTFTR